MTHDYQRTTADASNRNNSDSGSGSETFTLGGRVADRDADDPNTAVIVAQHDEPAYAVHIDVLDASVADVNEDYPASGPVVSVAFTDDLDSALDVWRSASPDALARICDDHDVQTYSYPVERLQEVDR